MIILLEGGPLAFEPVRPVAFLALQRPGLIQRIAGRGTQIAVHLHIVDRQERSGRNDDLGPRQAILFPGIDPAFGEGANFRGRGPVLEYFRRRHQVVTVCMAGDAVVLHAPFDGNAVDKLRCTFDIELGERVIGAVFCVRRRVVGYCGGASGVMRIFGLCGHAHRVQHYRNDHRN